MSRSINKGLFYFLLTMLFVEILFLGSKYIDKKESQDYNVKNVFAQSADQKMERVHLVEGVGSSKEWELFAETAEGFIGQGIWNLSKVKVIFYAKTGDSYTVQGKSGQIDTNSKDMDILGDVSTLSTNGYEFVTPSIHYYSATKQLNAPETLRLKGPKDQAGQRLRLQGRGITTFLENSLMNIESDVVADRQMSNGKNIKIQSQKAQLSGKSNMVRFYQSVKMYYDSFSIQGPEALFAYHAGEDVPQSIIVNGGVQVSDVEKKASAENLQIDLSDDRYILRGSPKVIQGTDELNGEEIILYDNGKKVKIQGINAKVKENQLNPSEEVP